MQRAALTSLLFLSMLLTPAHAQRDTTARLTGTVRSSINGLPVSGVMIAVKGTRDFNGSDSTGSVTLLGLRAGRQTGERPGRIAHLEDPGALDRKSTRRNSRHVPI